MLQQVMERIKKDNEVANEWDKRMAEKIVNEIVLQNDEAEIGNPQQKKRDECNINCQFNKIQTIM